MSGLLIRILNLILPTGISLEGLNKPGTFQLPSSIKPMVGAMRVVLVAVTLVAACAELCGEDEDCQHAPRQNQV